MRTGVTENVAAKAALALPRKSRKVNAARIAGARRLAHENDIVLLICWLFFF
jgi:hypothetical protein